MCPDQIGLVADYIEEHYPWGTAPDFGYLNPAYRLRLVVPSSNAAINPSLVLYQPGVRVVDGYPLHSRCAFVGLDPLVRSVQIVAFTDLRRQVAR